MFKWQLYGQQIFKRAFLKIKTLSERVRGKVFLWVIRVENRLLELLCVRFRVQTTQIKSVEVGGSPKFSLACMFVKHSLVSEWDHAEIGTCWEHSTFRFQELVSRNYIRFQHSLVEKEGAKGFRNNHIYSFVRNWRRIYVLNFGLDHFNNILKTVSFD